MGLVMLALSATTATADVETDGLWYFDWFKVQDAHDAGITGEGITIAMIDSPVNLDIPTLADADIRVQDSACVDADGTPYPGTSTDYAVAHHGTAVLSLLVGSGQGFDGQTGVKGLAPDATVLTYSAAVGSTTEESDALDGACVGPDGETITASHAIGLDMHAAMDTGADIISVSLGVPRHDVLENAIARAIREGVVIIASVDNTDVTVSATSPSDLNGVLSVNRINPDGTAPEIYNTDVVAPGLDLLHQGVNDDWKAQARAGGTSFATPIVAGNVALAMQKYPDATPNQLLQSVIRNTGDVPHELSYDPPYGYGVVITDVFLAADPTVYPDVNPLVSNYALMPPGVDLIWEGAVADLDITEDPAPRPIYTPQPTSPTPSAEVAPTTDPTPDATNPEVQGADETTMPGWLVPGIIAGIALLVFIAVVIVVIARKARSQGGTHGTE